MTMSLRFNVQAGEVRAVGDRPGGVDGHRRGKGQPCGRGADHLRRPATRSFYNRGNAILVEACVVWAATDPAADELRLACPAADPPGCLLL